jgi:hypothetical protein
VWDSSSHKSLAASIGDIVKRLGDNADVKALLEHVELEEVSPAAAAAGYFAKTAGGRALEAPLRRIYAALVGGQRFMLQALIPHLAEEGGAK